MGTYRKSTMVFIATEGGKREEATMAIKFIVPVNINLNVRTFFVEAKYDSV